MSQRATALCILAVDELLGELASTVFRALVRSGRLPVAGLVAATQLGVKEVKHGLATLILHGLALWYTSATEGTNYEASMEAAYRLLRYGRYVQLVEHRLGTDEAAVISDLLVLGNANLEDILKTAPAGGRGSGIRDGPRNGADQHGRVGGSTGENHRHDAISALAEDEIIMPGRIALVQPRPDNRREADKLVREMTGYQEGTKNITKIEFNASVDQQLLEWSLLDFLSRRRAKAEIISALGRSSRKRPRDAADDGSPTSPRKTVRFSNPNGHVNGSSSANGVDAETSKNHDNVGARTGPTKVKKGGLKKPSFESEPQLETQADRAHDSPSLPHRTANDSTKEGQVAVKIDFNQLSVMARSEMLARKAEEVFGKPTARVYAGVLRLVEKDIRLPQRGISSVDADFGTDSAQCVESKKVSVDDLLGELEHFDDLEVGTHSTDTEYSLPKASARFARAAEAARRKLSNPPKAGGNEEEDIEIETPSSEDGGDEEDDYGEDDDDVMAPAPRRTKRPDLLTGRKLTQERDAGLLQHHRATLLRQHLIMLSEQQQTPFLTYHPRDAMAGEHFTVPFRLLIRQLRREELFAAIHARYDPSPSPAGEDDSRQAPGPVDVTAARVARMLAECGKLDDKALANLSLINPKVLRARLAAMHDGGAVGVQELPRDTARTASRTLYLWFFDEHRCAEKVADDTYQAMARLLQRLRMERAARRHLLGKAERSDVRGNEAEWLSRHEVEQLAKWREFETRVWSEIGRLDELVALLRDY